MNFVQIYFSIGFATFICAYKTNTWPPQMVFKHYDIDYIVKDCYERCGTDMKELIEFEMTEDMDHLPDSPEIKCYFRCFGELSEAVELKSNKIKLGKFGEFFAALTRDEQEIYLGMGKGCAKRVRPIKELSEFTYQVTVCFKENDNKHFYLFY